MNKLELHTIDGKTLIYQRWHEGIRATLEIHHRMDKRIVHIEYATIHKWVKAFLGQDSFTFRHESTRYVITSKNYSIFFVSVCEGNCIRDVWTVNPNFNFEIRKSDALKIADDILDMLEDDTRLNGEFGN